MVHDGHMDNSAYDTIVEDIPEYGNVDMIQEWTALYYALIEEVDVQIGKLLHKLGDDGMNNTLIVFTSDHGEMLGAHGRRDKNTFYEESSHVPLFVSYRGTIQERTAVDDLVSHLDVFATILDYIGAPQWDDSDGRSLRPLIEQREISESHDEDVVVGEWDFRKPIGDQLSDLERAIDDRPSYMVRKGRYKLMIQKLASSTRLDMMFHLQDDPFEVTNLLGRNAMVSADDTVISKAEHLRCLLLDWMERLDGSVGYYSDPAANFGEGSGDISEIRNRQSWRPVGFWVSDATLQFGKVGWDSAHEYYVRNEYLYLGTRLETDDDDDDVVVTSIELTGTDASFFRLEFTVSMTLRVKECHSVKISFVALREDWTERDYNAAVVVRGIGFEERTIQLQLPNHGPPAGTVSIDAGLETTITTAAPEEQSLIITTKLPTQQPTSSVTTAVTDEAEDGISMPSQSLTPLIEDGTVCNEDSECISGACGSKWVDITTIHACCKDGVKFHFKDDTYVCGNQPIFASCFDNAMCQSQQCDQRICVESTIFMGGS
jgi:hypothetical protein